MTTIPVSRTVNMDGRDSLVVEVPKEGEVKILSKNIEGEGTHSLTQTVIAAVREFFRDIW